MKTLQFLLTLVLAVLSISTLHAEFRQISITAAIDEPTKQKCLVEVLSYLKESPSWVFEKTWKSKQGLPQVESTEMKAAIRSFHYVESGRNDILTVRSNELNTLKILCLVEDSYQRPWSELESSVYEIIEILAKYCEPQQIKVIKPISKQIAE